MSATPFTPVGADGGPLDPTKAVRYVEGMVLGVGDFQQEHAYLAGLANEALRLGAGVGTLIGLKVTTNKVAAAGAGTTDRYEVHVTKGAAIDGQGRLIRVPEEQCADIGAWVAAQVPSTITAKLPPPNTQLTGTVPVYVTVSFAQVATDSVPVPGEPCRTDDQLTAASRWRDDFQLNLALDPPPPSRLRQALWQYFVWTRYAVTLGATPSPTGAARNTLLDGAATLLADFRKLTTAAEFLPPKLPTPLPAGVVLAQLNEDDFELQMAWLDAANAALVTDVLPEWLKTAPADGDALLRAEMSIVVKRVGAAATDPWALDTSAATAPPASSRNRPVALAGPTLRVGPRGG